MKQDAIYFSEDILVICISIGFNYCKRMFMMICLIAWLLVFISTVCSNSYAKSFNVPKDIELDVDVSQNLPLNTLLFFTGYHRNRDLVFLKNNYIEDDKGNKIQLKYVNIDHVNTKQNQSWHRSEIAIFKPLQKLKENTEYRLCFPSKSQKSFSGIKSAVSNASSRYAIKSTNKIVTVPFSRRSFDDINSKFFKTSSKNAIKPKGKIVIESLEKEYENDKEMICPGGLTKKHYFKIKSNSPYPYYLCRITEKKTSLVDTIVVYPYNGWYILLFEEPCDSNYYFNLGEKYSIEIAPMNLAGDIGEFSEPFNFTSAKPPIIPEEYTTIFSEYGIYISFTSIAIILLIIFRYRSKRRHKKTKYTCPCCGYKTLDDGESGSYDICEICFWEHDNIQFDDPDYEGGANVVSLRTAQRNFKKYGSAEERFLGYVRKPTRHDVKDDNWKLLPPK
jgi:hypothetical protein